MGLHILSPGAIVKSAKREYRVERFLSEDSFYENYACADDANLLIRWRKAARFQEEQRERFQRFAKRFGSSESGKSSFVWPTDVVESDQAGGFGDVVPRERRDRQGLNKLFSTYKTFHLNQIELALKLIAAFCELRKKELCLGGVSFLDSFFYTDDYSVSINDVGALFECGSAPPYVISPAYMAPEIVVRKSPLNCFSDRHALAAALFFIFYRCPPLKEDPNQYGVDVDVRQFGEAPEFVFSDAKSANESVFWSKAYPRWFNEMFGATFVKNIKNPEKRFDESCWKKAIRKLRDLSFRCSQCGNPLIFKEEWANSASAQCWHCQKNVAVPRRRLTFNNGNETLLFEGRALPERLIDDTDYEQPFAEVIVSRGQWGIRVCSDLPFRVKRPNSSSDDGVKEVAKDDCYPIYDQTQFIFGPETWAFVND